VPTEAARANAARNNFFIWTDTATADGNYRPPVGFG
jgi:hypothetical protein